MKDKVSAVLSAIAAYLLLSMFLKIAYMPNRTKLFFVVVCLLGAIYMADKN